MRRAAVAALLLLALAGCADTAPPVPTAAPVPTQTPPRTPSQQETNEDVYYSFIMRRNLQPAGSDRERELRRGHAVCGMYDDGMRFTDILGGLVSNGYKPEQAGLVVGAATGTFCPEHNSKNHI